MHRSEILWECLKGMARFEDRFALVPERHAKWVCERLHWHKLMPLAAAVAQTDAPRPDMLTSAFRAMSLDNALREQRYYLQARHLFGVLADLGIKYTPFKGPFWGCEIYPDYSWRHIGDIDVLMDIDGARNAAMALQQEGYVLESVGHNVEDDFANRGELMCHSPGRSDRVPIELHWELMPARRFLRRRFISPDDLIHGAVTAEWKTLPFLLPNPEIRLHYMMLHATCQHQFNRFVLVMDMAVFVRRYRDIEWERLYHLAAERNCLSAFYYAFSFVDQLEALPDQAKRWLVRARPTLGARLAAGLVRLPDMLSYDHRRGRHQRKVFRVAMSW